MWMEIKLSLGLIENDLAQKIITAKEKRESDLLDNSQISAPLF